MSMGKVVEFYRSYFAKGGRDLDATDAAGVTIMTNAGGEWIAAADIQAIRLQLNIAVHNVHSNDAGTRRDALYNLRAISKHFSLRGLRLGKWLARRVSGNRGIITHQ